MTQHTSPIEKGPSSEDRSLCKNSRDTTVLNDAASQAAVPQRGEQADGIERTLWNELRTVEDPEMPVSIVDLGLIYSVGVVGDVARIDMTLTYAGCPAREMLMTDVRNATLQVTGIGDVEVNLVFYPKWDIDMVSEQGRADLRDFGLDIQS